MTLVFRHNPEDKTYTARLNNKLTVQASYRNEPGSYKIRVIPDDSRASILRVPYFTDDDTLTELKRGVNKLLDSAKYNVHSTLVRSETRAQSSEILAALGTVNNIEIAAEL